MLTLPSLRVFIPRKKKQSLQLFLACVVAMVMLCSVSMVARIHEVEEEVQKNLKYAVGGPNNYVVPGDNERQYQRVKRMNVIRETLAVGEDYPDLPPNGGNASPDNVEKKGEGKIMQAIFNYQRKNDNADMQVIDSPNKIHLDLNNVSKENRASLKETENKNDGDLLFNNKDLEEPFHKEIDENGNMVFEIVSKTINNREKPIIKFNKQGDNAIPNAYKSNYDGTDDEDNYDDKQYNYNPNPVFQDGDFDPPSENEKLPDKNIKFLFQNSIQSEVDDNPDDPAVKGKGFSSQAKHQQQAASQAHSSFQHAEPGKTWENSHQMGARNNDTGKTRQFVIAAGAKDGLRNDAGSNQPNLLEGFMDGDHKVMVSEACKRAGNCSSDNEQTGKSLHKTLGSDTDNKLVGDNEGPGAHDNQGLFAEDKDRLFNSEGLDHHNHSDQLNNNHDVNSIYDKAPNSSHILKNNLQPQDVDSVNNNDKIETQIPIQNGAGPVAVEYPATQLQYPGSLGHQVDLMNKQGLPLVVDKVFWSKEALDLVPAGLSEKEFQNFLTETSQQSIVQMENPTWRKCGRPKNQFVQLSNGKHMCARYREPHHDLVQGEILSFYLSRFLGFDNIPPVVLAMVDSNSTQWQSVKHQIPSAGWSEQKYVALIMWIDDVSTHASTKMPPVILKALEGNYSVTLQNAEFLNMTANQISEVIQWGDMLLFDYITGHYDRVASMQDGAVKEKKPSILHEDIRNLRMDAKNGKLWLIDNECGLLDAYELLYNSREHLFYNFHKQMLQTMCIFNNQTVDKIKRLSAYAEPHQLLVSYALKQEPLYNSFPQEQRIFSIFEKYFHTRLKEVLEWIEHCKIL